MPGIGIIANPHSKLNKRNPRRAELLGYIIGKQGQLEITESLEALRQAATDFCASEIDVLAINGGDGTISKTLTAVVQAYGDRPLPKVAILRGGTINVLANNLGILGRPEDILYRVIEAHSKSIGPNHFKTTTLRTLHVGGEYGFLFGAGVAPRFLTKYYQKKSGPLGAALMLARVWWLGLTQSPRFLEYVQRDHYRVHFADGRSQDHSSVALFCSTFTHMPFGRPLFRNIRGRLDAFSVASYDLEPKSAVWRFPEIMLDLPSIQRVKLSLAESKITFECEGDFEYTLDGELFSTQGRSQTVELGPAIEFIKV